MRPAALEFAGREGGGRAEGTREGGRKVRQGGKEGGHSGGPTYVCTSGYRVLQSLS